MSWATKGHFLWILKATDHGFGLRLSPTMIESIKHRFGRFYSGSIIARFQRGTITDSGDLSEMPFSFDSGGYRSRTQAEAILHR
ncbi:unnamed protein product [Linum trigynum]|uniref:Uncharacterized protein n=1 Tax=Linum trigynum TaxID=586398 RepID=A0AAV2ELW4_9ROSI